MTRIDRDYASAGRIEIGLKPKYGSVIVDKGVSRIEVVQQFHHWGIRLLQVFVIEAVLRVRALPHRDYQVMPVIADLPAEKHFFIIRPIIDQLVLRLIRSQAVVVKLLKVIGVSH